VIDPTLSSRVSLSDEKDLFTSTISSSLLAILRELELTIDPAFAAMGRSPWREAEYVSGESLYVGELERGLKAVVKAVREGVEQKKYVRSTCDKIVGCVCFISLLARTTLTMKREQSRPRQVYSDARQVSTNRSNRRRAGSSLVLVPLTSNDADSLSLQILLDLQSLKSCLLHLVVVPGDQTPIPTSSIFFFPSLPFVSH
jgi:hypothetical protein